MPAVPKFVARIDSTIPSVSNLATDVAAPRYSGAAILAAYGVVEAKAVGGASTVQVEAVVCTTLTGRSEPYNGSLIHTSHVEPSASPPNRCDSGSDAAARNHGSQWRHRQRVGSPPAGASLRVLQRGTVVCAAAERGRSLDCLATACGSRQWADSKRVCAMKHKQSDSRSRCGRARCASGDIAGQLDSPCWNKVLALCGRRRGRQVRRSGKGQVFAPRLQRKWRDGPVDQAGAMCGSRP